MPIVCGPFTTLESLDAVSVLDNLGFSLDDPIWDTNLCVVIDDGGYVTSAQKCGPFTLEELNYFGDLDSLQYSLDNAIWNDTNVCAIFSTPIYVDSTSTVVASAKVTYSGVSAVSSAANVVSDGIRFRTSTGAINATASVSSLANIVVLANGSINATSSVSSDAIRIRFTSGSINGTGAVSALGSALFFGNGSINGTATVTSNGARVRLGDASITSTGTVTSSAVRLRTSSGSISATGTVTSLGGVIYSGVGFVNGVGSVNSYANAIYSGNGKVTSNGTLVGIGIKQGQNWTPETPVPPDWQVVTPPVDPWTPVVTNPVLGDFYKGGYYVGTISYSGSTYDIVMSPIANEISANSWEQNFVTFSTSSFDGVNNNAVLIQLNPNGISKGISALNINGYKDWYFPSKDELTLMVNGSKLFTNNVSQKLTGKGYWSSTNKPSYNPSTFGWNYFVWAYDFTANPPNLFNPPPSGFGTLGYKVRPIRRIKR